MKPMKIIVPMALAVSILTLAPELYAAGDQSDNSVPRQISSLQSQINAPQDKRAALKFKVVFRDKQQQLVLAPGETALVTLICHDDEIVVTGGYNSEPSEVLQIVLNTPIFDGVHSGWRVDFYNPTDTTATVYVRITVSCSKGTGRGE